MTKVITDSENYTAIADAIRNKNGTSTQYKPSEMANAIQSLNTSSGSTFNLQSKSVTPSETAQTVKPDSGYDGLSSVSVGAISGTYVGSGVTQKAAATYTPGTSDQTIASGLYLSGTQTIKGDANLIAGNIKSGVSIFGVNGAYTASGSGSDSSSTYNCEAYIIDVTNPVVNFQTASGTIKAYGYAKGTTSGYTTPKYAFTGTQYVSISYSSDTTTDMTLSVDDSGNLTGLPSGLASGTILITRGI